MLTSKGYRQQAKACLQQTNRPDELYLRTLLAELTAGLNEAAQDAEMKEREVRGPDPH
jgi:hypothetical protein